MGFLNGSSDNIISEEFTQTRLDTPVLFLIYNRPDTAQEVFNAIRKVRPKKFYVASDGPRPGNASDIHLCKKSRDILLQIDWDCELHTRFLDKNLGCDSAVRSGITWFFENEEAGIILEDDIVPNRDFFFYCEYLLKKYESHQSVMMISGYNPVSSSQQFNNGESYYCSRWASISGWSSWKDRWEKLDMVFTDSKEFLKSWYRDKYFNMSREFQILFGHQYEYYSQHPNESPWDLQWCYTLERYKGVCIVPRVNLITNIGQFGYHSNDVDKKSPFLYLPTEHLDVSNLNAPISLLANKELDTIRFNHYVSSSGILRHLYLKLLYLLHMVGMNTCTFSRYVENIYEKFMSR